MKAINIQDAEKIVLGKANEDLLAMLSHPAEWAGETLAAAQAELQKRGVAFSPPAPTEPKAIASAPTRETKPMSLGGRIAGWIILLFFFWVGFLLIWSTANEWEVPLTADGWQRARLWDPWLWVPGALLMAIPVVILIGVYRPKAKSGKPTGEAPAPSVAAGGKRRLIALAAVIMLGLLAYWIWDNCPYNMIRNGAVAGLAPGWLYAVRILLSKYPETPAK